MMSDINHAVNPPQKYFIFENQPYKCKMKKVSLYKYIFYDINRGKNNLNIAF